jgi:hypothetical protein
LVDGFRCDEEKNFPRQVHNVSLFGDIMGLALEGEFWEVVNLGEIYTRVGWTPRAQFCHSGLGRLI